MNTSEVVYCADVVARLEGPSGPFIIVERLGSVKGLALPGGKQDPGESLSQTATRELYEETGLVLTLLCTLRTAAEPNRDPRGHYVSTVFEGIAQGTPTEEPGKTRVLFLTEEEIRARSNDFVFDHFSILTEYFARS